MTDMNANPRDLPLGSRAYLYACILPGDNQTIESQLAELRSFCAERKWIIAQEFFDESRKARKQDGFEYMVYLARQKPRPADVVLVFDSARFGCNEETQYYCAELRRSGVYVLSVRDEILVDSLSRLFEIIIDLKETLYRSDIRQHTLRGLRFLVENGCVPVGRICPGYSFENITLPAQAQKRYGKLGTGRKPIPDEKKAPLVVIAFEMKARGATNGEIARATRLFREGASAWNHLFQNRAYIGEYRIFGTSYFDVYPPLIHPELFDAAQKHIRPRPKPCSPAPGSDG